jgi:AcrR family transcriptional regulator
MRDSAVKRRRILQAAQRLLAQQGFDGMTLANVSKASGAAVGSIVHFFTDKAGLAAAVSDDLASGLAADAAKAVHAAHGPDVAATISALLLTVLRWPSKFPDHQRLIGMIGSFTLQPAEAGIEQRLGQVLADWAEPLIRAGAIAPLSPSQLYAVVLAPAIYAAAPAAQAAAERQGRSIEWLPILAAAALAAITSDTKSKHRTGNRADAKARRGIKQLGLSV